MDNLLTKLWKTQVSYNRKIRGTEFPDDFEYWMKQYLLGLISEVDEVLFEINWKKHRRGTKVIDKVNLGRELVDITKYTLCLWEHCGFTLDEMLEMCWEKTVELEHQYIQDFQYKPTAGVPIIITDIDGTLGDFRKAFRDWVIQQGIAATPDDGSNFSMEIGLGLSFEQYLPLKEKFEAEGGYKNLSPYPDAIKFLQMAERSGIEIIAYTARPAQRYSRIWSDTKQWLDENLYNTCVREVRIGAEDRISRACSLRKSGHPVLMLEDDPTLALRAANAGIRVLLRAQAYNAGVAHPNILRVNEFSPIVLGFLQNGRKNVNLVPA